MQFWALVKIQYYWKQSPVENTAVIYAKDANEDLALEDSLYLSLNIFDR